MYDELTKQDIAKMQEEIDYRVQQLRSAACICDAKKAVSGRYFYLPEAIRAAFFRSAILVCTSTIRSLSSS